MNAVRTERITPIRVKSKRQIKRDARMGRPDDFYNQRVSKRGATKLSPFVTVHFAR